MEDLTILFITANRLPPTWSAFQLRTLLEAAGDIPIISISKKPMDVGINLLQPPEHSSYCFYQQILRGAKDAKTPYIALAEDDCAYDQEHFRCFRPPLDAFAHNMTRWSLFTFGEPTYSFKLRIAGCCGIYPRELAIEALTERFNKYPNGIPHELLGELGYQKFDKRLGVTVQKSVQFYSTIPVIQFHHTLGVQGASHPLKPGDTVDPIARMKRKRMGDIRAYDVPKWGRSEDLVKLFS